MRVRGRRGVSWGEEPEELWGRIGSGESPQTGGGDPVRTLPGDYPAYYAAVASALRGEGGNPVTASQAAAALDVLEAARRSAREGVSVTLGPHHDTHDDARDDKEPHA